MDNISCEQRLNASRADQSSFSECTANVSFKQQEKNHEHELQPHLGRLLINLWQVLGCHLSVHPHFQRLHGLWAGRLGQDHGALVASKRVRGVESKELKTSYSLKDVNQRFCERKAHLSHIWHC